MTISIELSEMHCIQNIMLVKAHLIMSEKVCSAMSIDVFIISRIEVR